jgi:fumarylacetoacetase
MNSGLDETHDPARRSWVDSANSESSDFPIQNLPFGVFEYEGYARCGVAIGDSVLDLPGMARRGLVDGQAFRAALQADAPALNGLMAMPSEARAALRLQVSRLLQSGAPAQDSVRRHLVPASAVKMRLPAVIGDYTDFYASVHHATRVGALFRPDSPLLPNYKHVPIAYHGRSSSIVLSGAAVTRPNGQMQNGSDPPRFGPSRRLDYELEIGLWIGPGNALGEAVAIDSAERHLFGFGLVNDWSARDLQRWEYQPLGPFLAKNFATTVSPWVVTIEALAPFRKPAAVRPKEDPAPLAYLDSPADRETGGFDIRLEVRLRTQRMRLEGAHPMLVSQGSFLDMYWTPAQMVAHHTSNGCNLRPGDLLASGTVSGPESGSEGCLLELTAGGKTPISLPTGEQRMFLEDGDEVSFSGRCVREGFVPIGFGECRGVVTPAPPVS